jgi:hypothetical protein
MDGETKRSLTDHKEGMERGREPRESPGYSFGLPQSAIAGTIPLRTSCFERCTHHQQKNSQGVEAKENSNCCGSCLPKMVSWSLSYPEAEFLPG